MSKTITIIDTFGFFFRSFYALPPLSNSSGFPTGLLTGFANFISSLHRDHSSDYIVFALDSKGDTFRNEIDPTYKANRQAPPIELSQQLPVAIEWIEKMGFKTLSKSGYEADDMIASLTKYAKERDVNVRIVSHDKDLYQLIDDGRVVVVDAIKRKDIDEEECISKYSVKPEQFIDYQALLGDSADNIKGVKGIGKVTAAKLLNTYGSLENIYKNIDLLTPPRTKKLLQEGRESAFISKALVTLRDDVLDKLDFDDFKMEDENPFYKIYDELKHYEMNAILRVLDAKKSAKEKSADAAQETPVQVGIKPADSNNLKFESLLITDENELFKIIDSIEENAVVAYDTETTGLDVMSDTMVGFSFCFEKDRGYYVPINHDYPGVTKQISTHAAIDAIKKIFTKKVVAHNAKYDLHITTRFSTCEVPNGCRDLNIYADTIILAWLNEPESPLSLDKLAFKYYQHNMISYKDTVKKNETFASVKLNEAASYACEDAVVTFRLFETLTEVLKNSNEKILDEAYSVEFRFIKTLINMENEGIKVDIEYLKKYKDELALEIDELTKQIYALASREFNINSTKQLGVVLFEELNLPFKKKTKTGYSTDEKVLNDLIDEHEIIKELLRYRELTKLQSTYVEPIIALALKSKDARIHTSFNQTRTATGRLSSTNPNLQNIPTRTAQGQRIREAFIADENKVFVGIDYSQIELRLLAHFSQDSVLLDAFNHDQDIHMQTAIRLFGDEAAAKRGIAKTVNFGVLYGMGQKKLSQTLQISTKESKEIIERYFASFPTLKTFFKQVVDGSKENGYVETLLGRRRYFDYENARPMFKAAYERESVNTVFQGSVSDLIKLAMNEIDEIITKESLNAKMLLQIHDELIFEVEPDEAETLGKRFQTIMENIVKLSIPLKTSLNISSKWSGLK